MRKYAKGTNTSKLFTQFDQNLLTSSLKNSSSISNKWVFIRDTKNYKKLTSKFLQEQILISIIPLSVKKTTIRKVNEKLSPILYTIY